MKFCQIMRVMKLTMILLTASCVQLSAATFAQRITIRRQHISILELLKEVRKQSAYDFFYDANIFDGAKPVDIAVSNAAIAEVLEACFKGQPYQADIKNNIVIIRKTANVSSATSAAAQRLGQLAGKVTDSEGSRCRGHLSVCQNLVALYSQTSGAVFRYKYLRAIIP